VVRGELKLRDGTPSDPAAFSTRIEIEHADGRTQLGDLLQQVPGLRVRDYGPGQSRTFAARAAETHQVVVRLDGIRLDEPGRGTVDLSLIDPFQLEAVEVFRSGGSTRFGSGSLGGSLALTTRRLALNERLTASLGYGTWNTLSARVSQRGSAGKLRYLASAVYRHGDGDFAYQDDNGRSTRRLNNDSERGGVLLKLDYPLGGRWRASLLNHLVGAWRGAPGPSMNPSAEARQHDLRGLTALSATHRGTLRPGGQLRLVAYHRYGQFGFDEQPGSSAARSDQVRADRFSAGAQASLSLPLSKALRIDGGAELVHQWQSDARTALRQRFTADTYLASRVDLWREHVTLVPAVRLLTASDYGAALAPKLGLVIRPVSGSQTDPSHPLRALELVANVNRSYRFPSFQELYLRIEGFQPNPTLEPEDAWTIDAGLRWRDGGPLAFELAYFRRWLSNTILYAPSGSFFVQPDNYSDARAWGIESAAELEPGWCVTTRVGYTYSLTAFSRLELPGKSETLGTLQLPGHPQHQLSARLEWSGKRCPAQSWRSAPSSAAAGSQTDDPPDPPDVGQAPWWRFFERLAVHAEAQLQSRMFLDRFNSETLVEEPRLMLALGGTYTFGKITVNAVVNNLLDKRDAVDTVGFPLAPRSFFATTTLSW
jgi:outer membrane receptor protein involved in Fe transport